ncbi:MAG: CRISPR-associated protein Cas4 [Bacteroidales bacterium]
MYTDDDLLQLSGIQHIAFCERQYALAYIEMQWEENYLTITGHQLHERVDDPFESESRKDVIYLRSIFIQSYQLGLYGRADLVELILQKEANTGKTIKLSNRDGHWIIQPVEYKRGKPKTDVCDAVQLCAQAICLEEMYGVSINSGILYYGTPHRRQEIHLDENLRKLTFDYAQRMHQLFDTKTTPPPIYKKHCHSCSLYNLCEPKAFASGMKTKDYLQHNLEI